MILLHPPGGTLPMICSILSTVETSVSGVTFPMTPQATGLLHGEETDSTLRKRGFAELLYPSS